MGIVSDTRACVGRYFLWVVAFPSLIAGYRFRYPCLWGVSVRVVRSSCVVGIVFDTYGGRAFSHWLFQLTIDELTIKGILILYIPPLN